MKRHGYARSLTVTVAALGALFTAACGSDDGGGPSADLGKLRDEYTKPTGTLKAADMKGVIKSLNESAGASSLGALSERTPTSAPAGLHPEGSSTPTCAQSGSGVSCTCPNGGSYDITEVGSSGGQNVSGTMNYPHCDLVGDLSLPDGSTESEVIDGTVSFALYNSPPPATYIYSGKITETIT